MKLDAHVHTWYSGRTSLYPLSAIMRDSDRVHLSVLDSTERQFLEIDRRRGDVSVLTPYLRQQGIFTSLDHVASRVNGLGTATHAAALVPWLDALEVRNGSRLVVQNRELRAGEQVATVDLVARPSLPRLGPAARVAAVNEVAA